MPSPSTLPLALETVAHELSRLPSIGKKSALRLALHLLKVPKQEVEKLGSAILALRSAVRLCSQCGFLAEGDLCSICSNPKRDHGLICVVEECADVLAVERTALHLGAYHVLHGRLAPLQGVLPEDLHLESLIQRVRTGQPSPVREVIAATNPTADGDATALYVLQQLAPMGVRMTRLAYGIANNSSVESADETTLSRALAGRIDLTFSGARGD
jgi:recombination protein RecR